MDFSSWNLSSPLSPQEQLLTPVASIASPETPVKIEWPYAVGSLDFPLFENCESGPKVQTIYPSTVSAGVIQGQLHGLDDVDPALGPLERLQRKWGIGDRKTRDGQPAKRRGPKPDSKPAMTRRQELNRQAQRTHRERKENYMRELEVSIDRYRKMYQQEVVAVREENKKLRDTLAAHGIQFDFSTPPAQTYASPSSVVGHSSAPGSVSGYQSTNFGSPSHQAASAMALASPSFPQSSPTSGSLPIPRSNIHGLDYEDVGLDFVGTLEQNCLQHKQYMVNRSVNEEDWVSGHALMATAPPRDHCKEHGMDVEYPHKMPDLPKPDLAKMLNLCARLPGLNEHGSGGELTPVMAWAFILEHPACPDMSRDDFEAIKDDLKPKVACYGFGAVLENFEVDDAIHRVLTAKNLRIPQGGMDMEWEMVRNANRAV